MKRFIFTSLPLLFALSLSAAEFYVSPQGSDHAKGTLENPFQTITQAQQAVRALKKEGKLSEAVTVYVRGGMYSLTSPIAFTHEDSGSEQAPVTYAAYQDEKPVFSGGEVVTGWKEHEKGVWVATLPEVKAGKWDFRQLYVNGALRRRARTPNTEWFEVKDPMNKGLGRSFGGERPSKQFVFHQGDIDPIWKDMNSAEAIIYHFWTDSHLPISSIDHQKNIITFGFAAGKAFRDDFAGDPARYIVENFYEAMDQPGEWFLNRKTGQLFYRPMDGEDMSKAEVIAPCYQTLMSMTGDIERRKFVEWMRIEGLAFSYANFVFPWGDCNNRQASINVKACINLRMVRHCDFTDCYVSNIGGFGIEIFDGCTCNTFTHNTFKNIAAGAIRISGVAPFVSYEFANYETWRGGNPMLRTGNNVFSDNTVCRYGQTYPSAMGILLLHGDGNLISHNHIYEGNKTAIAVGLRFTYARNSSHHNIVEYNHVHNIQMSRLLSDDGGINTLGVQPGTIIRNNLIHDIGANRYGGWGIYCDESSSHILIEHNITYNTNAAGIFPHNSRELIVRNNIFALGKLSQLQGGMVPEPFPSIYLEGNIVYWKEGRLFAGGWKNYPYEFYKHDGGGGTVTDSVSRVVDWNLYYNPKYKSMKEIDFNGMTQEQWNKVAPNQRGRIKKMVVYAEGRTWEQWTKEGHDRNSLFADPMFVDPDNYDFRLKEGSPAFDLGFKQIDVSTVGPRPRR